MTVRADVRGDLNADLNVDLRMDKARFFDWIAHEECRYELAHGRVSMLPFVTRHHALICSNIMISLGTRLDRSAYGVTQGDFAVETGEDSVRYADVMVEPFAVDGGARSTTAALLLIEVLSPSTMHIDFGAKREEYLALASLGSYVVCAQDQPRAWVWTRVDGQWSGAPAIVEGLDASVAIPILDIALPLAEIYAHVTRSA